jgi:uncharacterized protein (TIGR02186 family)
MMKMVRLYKVLTVMLCVLINSNAMAQTNEMAVEIANDHIDVTVGFTGSSIELFGDKKDKNAQIAIIVEGPRKDITIWKKERVLGAWMNSKYTTFFDMPVYYQYAFSADEKAEEHLPLLLENSVGHKALFEKTKVKKSKNIKVPAVFEKEFLDKKIAAGLYFAEPAEFKFMNDNFFRVQFQIPPSAATGEYTIKSFLIKNGKVLQVQENDLKVEQVGINAFVRSSSKDYSFIYALICIIFGVASGWFVSVLKVKP